MKETLLLVIVVCLLSVGIEIGIQSRYGGKWRQVKCVLVASFIAGILGIIYVMALSRVEWGWKTASEGPPSASDIVVTTVILFVDAFLISIPAAVPSGLLAYVYGRRRKQVWDSHPAAGENCAEEKAKAKR